MSGLTLGFNKIPNDLHTCRCQFHVRFAETLSFLHIHDFTILALIYKKNPYKSIKKVCIPEATRTIFTY